MCVCQFFSELERSVDAAGDSGLPLPDLFGEVELSVCSSAGIRLLLLRKDAEEAIFPSALGGSAQESQRDGDGTAGWSRAGRLFPGQSAPTDIKRLIFLLA